MDVANNNTIFAEHHEGESVLLNNESNIVRFTASKYEEHRYRYLSVCSIIVLACNWIDLQIFL